MRVVVLKTFFTFLKGTLCLEIIWRNTMSTEHEMKTLEQVKQTIEDLLIQYEIDSTETSKVSNTSEKTLLKIGTELVYVSSNMTDKEFNTLKTETANRLGNDASNINKVIKIAKNRAIMENKDSLPTGWGSLYLLAQIEPNEFDEFMADNDVNTKTTRKELAEMIAAFKGTVPTAKKPSVRLVVKPIKSNSILAMGLSEFELLLAAFALQHGWEVLKSKDDTIENAANAKADEIDENSSAENEPEYQQKVEVNG
jgi:hypothetical protein